MEKAQNRNRASSLANINLGIVSLVFLFYWGLLLLWGYRHWSMLSFPKRGFFIGLVVIYPAPWLHVLFDRKMSTILLSLSCYLALMFSVLLLGR
jgi:hypothetical protein